MNKKSIGYLLIIAAGLIMTMKYTLLKESESKIVLTGLQFILAIAGFFLIRKKK